ncbi:J domain-containing protein [Dyella sp.]|jgi:hypothetical protein|uniref:J domain-containing protein n=1 Tax=Dyella sp. TaxID=1869338 RepID=UPI002D788826|nr:J domain-containing protein [Dyella sp.]HET6432955.1 J domain-containing protein [Dyella sp.]
MSTTTGYIALYRLLGVRPNSSVDELRRAYRRHVATLHPDRTGDASLQQLSELQQLNALYSAALDFHRQHGRLPGAATARSVSPAPAEPAAETDHPTFSAGGRRWLAGVTLCVGAAIVWSARPGRPQPSSAEMDYPNQLPAPTRARAAIAGAAGAIRIGSSINDVLILEGRPISIDTGRWDYGPSWVRIENDRVVDWYSSPLRPLHLAHQGEAFKEDGGR